MIQIFCINKIKKVLAVGLSAIIILVVLSPFRSVSAAPRYTIGSPFTLDGQLSSTDYPGITSYYDLLVYSFWENYNQNRIFLNLQAVDVSVVYGLFDVILSNYKSVWVSEGFNPTMLCNIYCELSSSYCHIIFDFLQNDNMVWSPISFSVNSDGSVTFSVSEATLFLPYYLDNSTSSDFMLSASARNTNPFFKQSESVSVVTPKAFTYDTYRKYVYLVTDVNLNISNTPNMSVCPVGQYPFTYPRVSNDSYTPIRFDFSNWSEFTSNVSFRCFSSSFPFYIYDSSSFPNNLGIRFDSYDNTYRFGRRSSSNYSTGVFLTTMSDYFVYSSFDFHLYETPTPYPTVLPSISPTPLPIAYDVNIDGIDDGSTLGFLQGMFNSFQNISSTFTGVSWIASTIGYLFHYTPQFAFILFIPLIATLSFILGRNKS